MPTAATTQATDIRLATATATMPRSTGTAAMSPIRVMGSRRIATPTIPKASADGAAVAGKNGANRSGANTTAGEAAVGAGATGATDRAGAWLTNRGLEAIGTEMYAKERQDFQSGGPQGFLRK